MDGITLMERKRSNKKKADLSMALLVTLNEKGKL